jgi:hypothetical protein
MHSDDLSEPDAEAIYSPVIPHLDLNTAFAAYRSDLIEQFAHFWQNEAIVGGPGANVAG